VLRVTRPRVFSHTLISVDGRIEGFPPALGRYYDLAARIPHRAVLAGSATMVAAATAAGIDLGEASSDPVREHGRMADPDRPLLVVIDSQGRLTRFDWLRESGYFTDVLVVGSMRTPQAHRARLREADVEFEVFGDERVDLEAALGSLRGDRAVDTVRVDAGPGLNGALLAAGLLDEISVLLAPYLVGDGRSFLEGLTDHRANRLELTSAEPQPDGHLWLRYTVQYG
jgi:2,5-diamino-6-(ribosylamino)-4(3H)-pyrimidinone 5'-phosphate reductase